MAMRRAFRDENRKRPVKNFIPEVKNRIKNRLAGAALKSALDLACKDLFYISETDAPIEVIFRSPERKEPLFEIASTEVGASKNEIEKHTPEDFFDKLTAKRDWHEERDKKRTERLTRLRKLLESNLDDLMLFRSGRVRIEIVVLGFDSEGNAAGIRTKAVET